MASRSDAEQPSHTTVGVHRDPGFRRLWSANFSDETGTQFSAMAMQVTAVSVLGASTFQLGVLTALGRAAYLVIGIPTGAWVDRWRKRPVLVASGLVRALAVATVVVAFVAGDLTLTHLMMVAAVVSVAGVFFETAHTAILPALVGRHRVSEASARLQSTDSVMQVAGPGLAGAALARFPAPLLYIVSTLTGIVSAALVGSITLDERETAHKRKQPFFAAVKSGLSFVVRHVALRTHMIANAFTNLAAGAFMTIAPAFALRDLGLSPALYGIAGMVGSAAAIVTAVFAMRFIVRCGDVRTLAISYYLQIFAFLVLPAGLVLPIHGAITLAVSDAAISFVLVLNSVAASGIRARVTPLAMMGRISAVSRVVTLGVFPIGALIGGAIGTTVSNQTVLFAAALLAGCSGLTVLLSPLRAIRTVPQEWAIADEDTPSQPLNAQGKNTE